MKKIYLFRTALCVLATIVSACSSDELIEQQPSDKQITMTASDFKCADGSRTSINVTPDGGNFTWADNDTVGIFPNQGAQAYFPMINGAGTKTAAFNGGGWALKPSSTYAAYYPYNFYNRDLKTIPVNLEGQTQVGNASTAHLGKYDYMAAIAKTPSNGNVNFEFKHLCALVELNITVPNKGDLTSVTLSSEEAIFTTKGSLDLTLETPKVTPLALSKSIKVDLNENTTSADKETTKVYLMMVPIDLTDKTIKATIVNNGVEFKGSLDTRNLEAGRAYKLLVILAEQKPIQNVYHVTKAGTLSELIGEANKFKITELKLTGELNGTDIRFIREMAGRDVNGNKTNGILSYLDLYNAKVVEGGEHYYHESGSRYPDYFTKNNVLGDYICYQCPSLKTVTIPNSVTSIGNYAFQDCNGLTSITIPNSVTSIGNYAFQDCNGLTSIDIPNSVTSIGNYAFQDCNGLTSIDIPNSVTSIGDWAFGYCNGLTNITIPNSVTSINNGVFYDCKRLTSITIPNSVTSIGDYAFHNCEGLTSIDIPNSVTSIGSGAFRNCSGLTSIDIPNSVTSIEGHTFASCSGLTSITIPNSVISIGYSAFGSCKRLTSIDIPNSVTSIGDYAFQNCKGLTNITIPNSVTSIGGWAFLDCSGLTSIIVEKGMKVLAEGGLSSAYNCKKLYLPSTLEQIRSKALPEKTEDIYCFAVAPPTMYPNNKIDKDCKIYVPKTSVEKYKAAASWKEYAANIFEMPEGVIEP